MGTRGTGKSTYLTNLVQKHPKKVLIFDTDDNPIYREFQRIEIEMLPRWKSGIKRIINAHCEEVIEAMYEHLHNALIILEDATKYVSNPIPKTMRALLLASKQRNLDIIMTFHSFRRIPPDCYNFANFLEVFKTGEQIEQFKAKIPNFEQVARIQEAVESNASRFFHQTALLL